METKLLDNLETVIRSLELCAESGDDLTAQVYDHFFKLCPQAVPLMGHSDEHMRGRMVDQAFELIMDDNQLGEGNYLRWEINNHLSAYGVDVQMYPAFLEALKFAVQKNLQNQWSRAYNQAWNQRIAIIMSDITSHTN